MCIWCSACFYRVAEYIPPRPAVPRRLGGAEKSLLDYKNHVSQVVTSLLAEYRWKYSLCVGVLYIYTYVRTYIVRTYTCTLQYVYTYVHTYVYWCVDIHKTVFTYYVICTFVLCVIVVSWCSEWWTFYTTNMHIRSLVQHNNYISDKNVLPISFLVLTQLIPVLYHWPVLRTYMAYVQFFLWFSP